MKEIINNTGVDLQSQLVLHNIVEDARNVEFPWNKKKSINYTLEDVEARLANGGKKSGYDAFGRRLKRGKPRHDAEYYLNKLTNPEEFKVGRDGRIYNGLGWALSGQPFRSKSPDIIDLQTKREEKEQRSRWEKPKQIASAAALVAVGFLGVATLLHRVAPSARAAIMPPSPVFKPAEITVNANSGILFDARKNNFEKEYVEITDEKANEIVDKFITDWQKGVALSPDETIRIKIDKQLAGLGIRQRKEVADRIITMFANSRDKNSKEQFDLEKLTNVEALALPLEDEDKPMLKDAIRKR